MPLPPLAEPESRLFKLRCVVRGSAVMAILALTILPFNALQMLSLVLRPFSLRAFRAFNRWAADTWWGMTTALAHWGYGTHVVLYGDPLPMREHVILLANHQQMADITFLMYLAQQQGRLGDMKWFVKHALKWFPGVGWGMQFLDCLYVKRDWARDRASIAQTFASILRGRVPLWLMLFPEGTRLKPAKLQRSQAYAAKHGLQPLQHLLLPRTKGFTASAQGLRGHLHAVYDVTIGYVGGVPSIWQYIQGLTNVAHLHVRRFPIETLPEDETALTEWLHQRWREKDQRLERYYSTGAFEDPRGTA